MKCPSALITCPSAPTSVTPEGLEHAAALRAALIPRGRHPPWWALGQTLAAAAAAVLIGGDVLQLAEHVRDRTQLHLHRLGWGSADVRSTLCAHAAEIGQQH